MELPSPLSFLYALYKAPLSTVPFDWNPNRNPAALLAAFFVTHYLNRAIISPLRTPSRSKSHIIVPIAAIIFNLVNGPLMGTYLSSPLAREYLTNAYSRPIFWIGLGLAIVGLAGNILHDGAFPYTCFNQIYLNVHQRYCWTSGEKQIPKANPKSRMELLLRRKSTMLFREGFFLNTSHIPITCASG